MSMLIGRHLHARLQGDFGGRCYPGAAPQGGGKTPYVVYRVEKVEAEYTKDGPLEDRVTVEVAAVGRSYDEMASAAQKVRAALEGVRAEYEGFDVSGCELAAYHDGYDETGDLYVGQARYEFITNS